jgi:hypothetical protein
LAVFPKKMAVFSQHFDIFAGRTCAMPLANRGLPGPDLTRGRRNLVLQPSGVCCLCSAGFGFGVSPLWLFLLLNSA